MPLSPDVSVVSDEAQLWTAFRNDGSAIAREKLFAHHASFARNIARRHYYERSRGDIDLQDLYQLAYTGLLESLDRYDPQHGSPFRPFAAYRISGSISDGIVRMNEMREQLSWRQRAHRERIQSMSENNSSDTSDPIEKLGEIVVGLALGFMLEGTGLFVPEESESGDIHSAAKTAYDSVAWKDMVSRLQSELSALPEREQIILRRHYIDGLNFDDISSLLAISKGRISQIHRSALAQLRKRMKENGHSRIGSTIT